MNFIKPEQIVAHMGLKAGQTVADFGSGSGFYAAAIAKHVQSTGKVYALDIQEPKLAATKSVAQHHGHNNVKVIKANLDEPLTGIPETSCDAVVMASIVHEVKSREVLFKNAYKVLKTGGLILVVEWNDKPASFGPIHTERVPQAELELEFEKMGLQKQQEIPADGYHYAVVFKK